MDAGFTGFVPLAAVARNAPALPGVYIVLRASRELPKFLSVSTGGHFKGKDPTVPVPTLQGKWVRDTDVVYIGQGGNLRRRLSQLHRFGMGMPVGHWGGRYLWQLADSGDLLGAWRVDSDPLAAEASLLAEFVSCYGTLPFAMR